MKDNKTGFNYAGPVGNQNKFDVDSAANNINSYNVNSTSHETVAGLSNSTDSNYTSNKTGGIASDLNDKVDNSTEGYRNNGKAKPVEKPKSTTPVDRRMRRDDNSTINNNAASSNSSNVNANSSNAISSNIASNNSNSTINNNSANSTNHASGKYIVEADTPANNFVEAEDAGTILGKKYYEYNETTMSNLPVFDSSSNNTVPSSSNSTDVNNGTITQLESPTIRNTNMYVKRTEEVRKSNLKK